MAELQSLRMSVGVLGISGGSLLLSVNGYGSSSSEDLIPLTALGIQLLIIAVLLAYAGVRRSLSHGHLFSTLCLSVSALWGGSGLIYIVAGQTMAHRADLQASLVPGLAAFTLTLLFIGIVAVFLKKVVLCLMAVGISLACAHQIASLSDSGFGQSATAANYFFVCLVGAYFSFGCLLPTITQGKLQLPGFELKKKPELKPTHNQGCSDVASVSVVMNLLAASVSAWPLVGVVPQLSCGYAIWLLLAGVFQLGMCVLFYRAMDPLAATFCGFTATLKFAEGFSAFMNLNLIMPVPFFVVFAVLFFILALFSCQKSLLEGIYQLFFAAYCIAIASQPKRFYERGPQGVQVGIFIASAGMLLVTTFHMVSTTVIPVGQGYFKALATKMRGLTLRADDKDLHSPYLGYSKYADAEVLGHACSVLAAFAITATTNEESQLELVLPWVVIVGAIHVLCGSVAFACGKTFESTAFILYGVMWILWVVMSYLLFLYGGETRGFSLAVGIISFILLNCLVVAASLFVNVAWFAYSLTFQLIIINFLLSAIGALPYGFCIAVSIIFGLVSFYCFLAHIFNSTFQSPQIPLGKPLIKMSGVGGGSSMCPHVPACKATSVQQIAEIMKNGGICGMPTDTVYVLVAACNRPDAVVKAFKVKKQAQDRPMSLWISSIKQLEPVRHLLSPLLLDFMQTAWPSSLSMVIARGPWLDIFGLGDAAKHIGTPQSIAIRIPDCSVATHLINLVGPIAVTSANPTGEADTTHHNQVYAKLGDKVDGVLCDGPSPENIASTVVDCTKIETGHIGFFRVGLIPKSKVLQIFEEVKTRHQQGKMNPAFEYDDVLPDMNSSGDSGNAETGSETGNSTTEPASYYSEMICDQSVSV
ncbi:uncharacterized protein si:ch211-153b23.4 [Thalassophryne amazonica]|uniref:uncharacterized protein si:ch211-153b23.4 n=1 Tax=Thalassophryne amazonica TaxID=390379 RepID=UPI001470AD72|nr:uncharacterized protein si:ch211-153b23.4 [Thalassophryne amazonica]